MNANDGGPAFPLFFPESKTREGKINRARDEHRGMSLRDYFAAKACERSAEVICDLLEDSAHKGLNGVTAEEHAARHATAAYLMADALLKAREAKS